jgi:hypothetical protein
LTILELPESKMNFREVNKKQNHENSLYLRHPQFAQPHGNS